MREQQEYMELCLRSHEESAEILWLRITGRSSTGDNVPSVCCRSHKGEVAETLFRHCKKTRVHRLVLISDFSTFISSRRAAH